MDEFQIPQLHLDKSHSDTTKGCGYLTWTNWLETLFTLCDNLDRLCHAIDPQFPTYTHDIDNLDCSNIEDNSTARMNANALKHRTQQTLERDANITATSSVTGCVDSDGQRAETDPNEVNRYIRSANLAHAPSITQTHKSNYPCNLHYNNVIPQHTIQITADLPPRSNISNSYTGGYSYSPISNNTNGSNTDQYCYTNDAYNLDYQYQLYLDAWAQSVQPSQHLQSINQQTIGQQQNPRQFDCKDMVYTNYQYTGVNGADRYNSQSPSLINKVNQINYDGSTTPTTSTPNYSPTYNTRRRKDDLSVPKATNEFDYLLSMPSQRIPVNSKDDMKCEIAGVYWDKRSWIASWYEDGKRYYKSFSARTHGFYRSKYFAIQIRLGKVRQNIIKQQRPRPRRINHT
ncbi:hypothetical protein BMR1_02g03250 [Babesia microti strain RI]|uniref:Uncharacterized protein n=1 Tax=Babesia microti (strain RI) TaxID=1133968 RepID=I7I8W6_BABMR|nr:hypothetical protein BMR1_02g03250 [Babesia microti strain RI]CCF73803.1 hypothetical protein BMR1_02g03250 [Babesia microti strain RI]|eukprot:XP_012648412.1 hypothetical protein BMR1_02g03250 [Babesia microti strain RI]